MSTQILKKLGDWPNFYVPYKRLDSKSGSFRVLEPLRPKASVVPAAANAGSSSSTVASFRDFEESVSDAWNASADDLLPATHR